MPEPWIERTIQPALTRSSPGLDLFPVWLLLGPRQVGKSSVLLRASGERRTYVNLDDLATRTRATADPILFASELRPPLLVDEIQYAPQLLPAIKVLADAHPGPGAIWLTGSQSFEVMRGVEQTLAGRVALLRLDGLATEERPTPPTSPDALFEGLMRTRFPRLNRISDPDARDLYLSSYLQTYIERDVRELLGIQKRREFERFVALCALRTGQLVNYDDLGRDAGISATTAREWLGLLEDTFLVALVRPWHSNRSKRLIKSPKLYFLDAGLAAWLAGWRTAEQARLGPMGGALLESQILGDILSAFHHRALSTRVYFWRTRDGLEIDFLVEARGAVRPIEVKLGTPGRLFPLERADEPGWSDGLVVSTLQAAGVRTAMAPGWTLVSPLDLPQLLTGHP